MQRDVATNAAGRARSPIGSALALLLSSTLAACAATSTTPEPAASTQPPVQASGPTDTPAPTPTSPSPSPEPTLPPPVIAGWQPANDATATSVQFQQLAWTGERFVAVGLPEQGDGEVLLDSADGRAWHLQATRLTGFASLGAGPSGLVLARYPSSWTSSDGLAWTSHAGSFPKAGTATTYVEVKAVIATPDGWLAVGREDPFCTIDCGVDPVRALVWRSLDGRSWTRVPDQLSLRGGAMNSVAVLGDGFVAAGDRDHHAQVWTSSDGLTWTRVVADPAFGPRVGTADYLITTATGVAAGPAGVVVVGMDTGGQDIDSGNAARGWWSTDGRHWSRASIANAADGQIFSVAAVPSGFLAVGPSAGCPFWESSDGRSWSCPSAAPGQEDAFAGFGPYASAASPTIEIAAGLTSFGFDPESPNGLPGAVWWRVLP